MRHPNQNTNVGSQVEERDVARNYGFIVSTLDERQYVLSAVTHGIRNNWINALKSAANLNNIPEKDDSSKQVLQVDEPSISEERRSDSLRSPSQQKSRSPSLNMNVSDDKSSMSKISCHFSPAYFISNFVFIYCESSPDSKLVVCIV